MASSPITSWEIVGETVETVSDFLFWCSKITADGDCSCEIKRHLLLGREVMTHLDSIFKSRDITLPTKVHLVKAIVFPVVKYGCESWTLKKVEHWRTDALELWCWRRLLRVPWTARRSNQYILKEISPRISLEGMMLKLKLQYFGHLMQKVDSWKSLWCWVGLVAGGEGDDRGWDAWMASLTRWMWVWVNSRNWSWIGRPGVLQFMGRKESDTTEWLNWTEHTWCVTYVLPALCPQVSFFMTASLPTLQMGYSAPFSGFHLNALICTHIYLLLYFVARNLNCCVCNLIPWSNLGLLYRDPGVLTTGLTGQSSVVEFFFFFGNDGHLEW